MVKEAGAADILIVNTCGFIEEAKRESIEAILELVPYRRSGRCRQLIVVGCLAQRYGREIAEEIPDVDHVVGVGDPRRVVRLLAPAVGGEHFARRSRARLRPGCALRHLLTPGHFAFLKIAEGCDNRCSYCAVPLIRGRLRSRSLRSVIKEARALAARGVRELALVAQDTASYGTERFGRARISELLRALSAIDGISWIRLLYVHPAHVTEELIAEMSANEKVCAYVDLPLQHCDDRILARMGRKITRRGIERKVARMRGAIPGISIRTTLMVGFPGEGRRQFRDLLQFVEELEFDHLGAFAYSREEGTPAAAFPEHVRAGEKEERLAALLGLQRSISLRKNRARIGERCRVLLDERAKRKPGELYGRTEGQAWEVDGKVVVTGSGGRVGQFADVRIRRATAYDLFGELIQTT
jgi:ribosomal protein S12 methylthiotransferase